MYAFRKPFTAATFADASFAGIGFKTLLVTAQVLGYTLSKFLGIKIIAEVSPGRRVGLLLFLIALAETALLLFALVPFPFNIVALFGNGLALGMVFGLVLGFLEGRRQTEALAAGLCASFIMADGMAKSVGAALLLAGISPFWMPFLVGVLFSPPLLLFVWMLSRITPPGERDIEARGQRSPMTREERWRLFRRYAFGLTVLLIVYMLITVLRSVRADFAAEIWLGLQASTDYCIFARSEMLVAAGVMLLNGAAVFVQINRTAFFASLGLALAGPVLVIASLLGLRAAVLSPFAFMVLHGMGLYLPYIAVHTTVFERLMAMTRERGNIGYLMYLADAFGYLGYVLVMLGRHMVPPSETFLNFFIALSWVLALACILLLLPCWRYFALHPATRSAGPPPSPAPAPEPLFEAERGV